MSEETRKAMFHIITAIEQIVMKSVNIETAGLIISLLNALREIIKSI